MAAKRKKTVGQAMMEVREHQERAAVQRALAGYLRTRYLPRDSMSASAQIRCEGSPVQEAMIEEIALELEDGAKELLTAVQAYQAEEIA